MTDYRYIGTLPNNYVRFKDEKGKKEQKIKIIRNQSLGYYSWDNTGSTGNNDWNISALQKVLNSGAHYNRANGTCLNNTYGSTTSYNFSSSGLTEAARNMIGKEKWYLEGFALCDPNSSIKIYEYDRGTRVGNRRPIN